MWQNIVYEWLASDEVRRSQDWLAEQAECSESWLNQCLQGKKTPKVGLLYTMEAVMGVKRGTLVGPFRHGPAWPSRKS
jgi:hypothetical protein